MKHIAKIAAFTAIFLIINLILCGFMPPDNGSSLDMWRSYHQKQSIDIAVIGSSLASCALPEEELAAATGETVALMATNAQSLDMSQIALETLLREHSPRYVILVMDLTNMTGKPYAKAQKAFLYAELQTDSWKDKLAAYKKRPLSMFLLMAVTVSAVITVGVLGALVIYILANGIMNLSPELFAWKYTTENVSMLPAIINTFLMTALSLLIAVPIGICSAIYLVEYAKRGNKLVSIVRITTETLSGIPSIVYGLFGYLMFVIAFGWGLSFFGGALTLSIMVLPTIMRTTEEALLSVPDSYREGSFGLGAGRLRTIFKVVLPSAVPGILSGVILAIGRIVGETAALIFTSGTTAEIPKSLFDSGCTLAVHMYKLLSEGLYTKQAYATAVVLLVMVVIINAASGKLAKKLQAK